MRGVTWPAPLALVPALFVVLAVMARLARRRPALRPLLPPLGVLAALASALLLFDVAHVEVPESLPLLLLAPLLVLAVRACLLAFDALFRRSRGEVPPSLLDSLVAVVLYAVGLGVVAHVFFGFDPTPFLAGSAVVGAVVGLALQDALANLFSGIALHTEAPFRPGDWVRIGDAEGRVETVTWRALRLRTWSNDTLTLPNHDVSRSRVLNFSRPDEPHTRVVQFGVSYDVPPNRVTGVIAEALRQVPGLPAAPAPSIRLIGFGESAVQYEVRYPFAAYEDWRRIESDVLCLVWYQFRRGGIEIPFPIRRVFLHQAEPRVEEHEPGQRLQRALRSLDVFSPLSDEERRTAAAAFRPQHYAAGERILNQGDPGDSLFLIDRGEVEVSARVGGVARPVARLSEGQFFGEMALLTGEARAASVTAATDVDLFVLDKAGFEQVLAKNPAVAVDISAILAARRDALAQAQGSAVPAPVAGEPADTRQHILQRIRGYFGL